MASDVSVIVADVSRMAAIRDGIRLPGRMMHFTSGNLAGAMETIRSCRPRLVAIDALFVQTPAGAAFLDRVDAMAVPGSTVRLIVLHDGRWIAAPRAACAATMPLRPVVAVTPPPLIEVPPPVIAAVPDDAAILVPQPAVPNTRRAPRFLVTDLPDAAVEGGRATLVDLSVLGAQLVSRPTLRPNQRISVWLPDSGTVMNVVAHVAWSTFERPRATVEPYYRAGIEFTRPSQELLEDYRRRHCADEPIPYRGR